ncbi:ABC transporter ATP-binding protein [Leptospira sp. GIMC2001]|uniref:ABC transporter ATP-binding protein n=1 Tax=Leptospira sp. GIMC2001 TaxID=1513297 RepID=UPI002349FBEF|nr:ABC transporter ATP-binding protein [Leptospira sp. GIMC2001]WCL49462.1 ABC transporter ATP-binding protein [Leptospira sp. GIMC2001]
MSQTNLDSSNRSAVEFKHTSCHFGDVKAVDDVSFSIREGEFFSMLGPSGSGKTTCLRLIAGFESPTSGNVFIHGNDAGNLPPYERDVNTVFQDYALFPHMSVGENVEYGLMIKKIPKSERKKQALDMLELIQLPDVYNRKPSQLSGGQRQRVALARALINKPRVLLLDEPLGALDLKLREQMQSELKQLQRKVGITFVFVTHDQEEALTMSDRIAVFNQGKVSQIGTPFEVYEKPSSEFVANFVGQSNIFRDEEAKQIFQSDKIFMVRPEKISLITNSNNFKPSEEFHSIKAIVEDLIYSGSTTRIEMKTKLGNRIVAIQQNGQFGESGLKGKSEVTLQWKKADSHVITG